MPEDSRKAINKSLKDLDEGKGISHEKVKKCILDGSQNNLSATLTSPFPLSPAILIKLPLGLSMASFQAKKDQKLSCKKTFIKSSNLFFVIKIITPTFALPK